MIAPDSWMVQVTGYREETDGQRRWVDARACDEVEVDKLSDCTMVRIWFNGGRQSVYHFDDFDDAVAFARSIRDTNGPD